MAIQSWQHPAALAWLESVTNEGDAQTFMTRRPSVRSTVDLSARQLWGRIFSFLPRASQAQIARTSREFRSILSEEREHYFRSIVEYIRDNYVILDTNTEALQSLEGAIKKGVVFLLGSSHAKRSHQFIHETFMKLASAPESRIFTEMPPRGYTKDRNLLSRMEAWGYNQRPTLALNPTRHQFPHSVSPVLKSIMDSTRSSRLISIGLTLFYMHLVNENDGQKFAQNLLFFLSCYRFEMPPNWPHIRINRLATGVENSFAIKDKQFFLTQVAEMIHFAVVNMSKAEAKEMDDLGWHHKRNDDLIAKISSAVSAKMSVIAEAGCLHFFDDELPLFFDQSVSSSKKKRAETLNITGTLSQKGIFYMVLYPREPLFPNHLIQKERDPAKYRNWMRFYFGAEMLLTEYWVTPELRLEGMKNNLLSCLSKEQLIQEFKNYLKNPKGFPFPWNTAGRIVREHLLETFNKNFTQ